MSAKPKRKLVVVGADQWDRGVFWYEVEATEHDKVFTTEASIGAVGWVTRFDKKKLPYSSFSPVRSGVIALDKDEALAELRKVIAKGIEVREKELVTLRNNLADIDAKALRVLKKRGPDE